MFSEDGDSRDSGYSETMTIGSQKLGPTTFPLSDDLRDMDEVFQSDESNDGMNVVYSNVHAVLQLKSHSTSNGRTAISCSTQSTVDCRIMRSSAVHLPRKRPIPCAEDNDLIDTKRIRQAVLTSIENETPPSRKFSRSLKVRSFSRVNSTSVLEIKTHHEEEKEYHTELPEYTLPIVELKDATMAFRRLEAKTLGNLMSTLTAEEFNKRYIVIDCRYPFEYDGGHVRYAINFYEQEACGEFFFHPDFNSNRIPIFYCEYSQKRGPTMAIILRACDRVRNTHRYPQVTFSEMYVLDQGYKGFYNWAQEQKHYSLCTPNEYVKMDDFRFQDDLRGFAFHKKNHRKVLARATEAERKFIRRSPKSQARRPLFKSATIEITPMSPMREESLVHSPVGEVRTRLNFSLSSPDVSFS